jgi:hypothetical protein
MPEFTRKRKETYAPHVSRIYLDGIVLKSGARYMPQTHGMFLPSFPTKKEGNRRRGNPHV